MKIFQIPFVLLWLLYAQVSVGQNTIAVSAALDKSSIIIGEPAQLKLEAFFPANNKLSFFAVDSFARFEILSQSKIDTVAADGGTRLSQTFTLTSWDSGAWAIPPIPLQNSSRIRTKPINVAVGYSPMAPDQKYHEVKDILAVQQPARITWYWYVVGALLLLILFWLLFPKKKRSAEPVVIMQDVYKQTLAQLDALKSRTGEEGKEYFTSLILIFRNYLQQRKGLQSHSKTTDDISRQLRTLQLDEKDYNELVQTLQLSDFVKFAKYVPAVDEKEAALNTIKKSIVTIEHNKA
jgi:hypothetical protein